MEKHESIFSSQQQQKYLLLDELVEHIVMPL